MSDKDCLLRPDQCMKRLSIGRSTFYNLVNSGDLAAVRVGTGERRLIRVKASVLAEYIQANSTVTPDDCAAGLTG